MTNPLEHIQIELEKLKNKYVFQFINKSTAKKLSKNEPGKFNSKVVWSYDDVISYFGSFTGLLKHMQDKLDAEGVNIEFRTPNGSRSQATKKKPLDISFKKSQPMQTNNATQQQQQTTYSNNNNNNPIYPQNFGLAGPGQNVGLGFAQVLDYEKKANRLELLEENYRKLQQENDDLRILKNKLQLELDDATSKCKLAEDRKDFEVEKVRSEKKSTITPELMQQITPLAMGLFEAINGSRASAQPDAGLGNPYAGLSKNKQELIATVANANLSENQIILVYEVIENLPIKPGLEIQLSAILNQ